MFRGLEIGGCKYPVAHQSFEQFDLHPWEELKSYKELHIGDARDLSRFEDETFDEVISSQTLEHFGWRETIAVLREWMRVVKVDGQLHLWLPDLLGMCEDYIVGKNPWIQFVERVYGSQDYEGNTHYTMFTKKEFPKLITQCFGENVAILYLESIADGGGFEVICLKAR